MQNPSTELNAAIRAIHGESDMRAILPALSNEGLAKVIACASGAHPLVRAVASLCGDLLALLDAPIFADPAFHNAVARLIGTNAGRSALWRWTQIAPAGWGAAYADDLVAAVNNDTCIARAAAALIGPVDECARLLHDPDEIAFAIRCWGRSSPNAPTAWVHALSVGERKRMMAIVQRSPSAAASCLPWLPPDMAHQMHIDQSVMKSAIDAFAEASPTARAQHAALLQCLVKQTPTAYLDSLTCLSRAMDANMVWRRVQALMYKRPSDAYRVVAAVPWNDLPDAVRATALRRCPDIGAARGQPRRVEITWRSATAFFAALDPRAWDALDRATQRRWRDALPDHAAHLAVRSLGPRPEFLARAGLTNDLVRAVQRHACDDAAALRRTLLPAALRTLPPDEAGALIAALPTPPPDPGAFFVIASGHPKPSVIPVAHSTLRTSADLACAVALRRCADGDWNLRDRCTMIQSALRGWTWDDLTPILPLLDNDVRAAFIPNDEMVNRAAYPYRQEAFRQALARLTTLPPAVAIPTCVALSRRKAWEMSGAAEAIADALHAHGDVFLAIVDAIANEHLRDALLPLPKENTQADTLRALARENPQTAQRMAHALRSGNWRAATDIALHLSAQRRDALTPSADALVERLAHPSQRNALRQALARLDDLSLDSAILTRFALIHAGTCHLDMHNARMAAEDVARTLHDHGDVFLAIFDAIANKNLRNALLPLPNDAASANALRNLARDDPTSAHRLAHARRDLSWHAALHALLTAPPHHADAVWQTFAEAERSAMTSEVPAVTPTITALAERDPIAGLALAATQANDADLRGAGIAALAARPDVLRAIWMQLPRDVQQALRSHPAASDMSLTSEHPVVHVRDDWRRSC